MRFSQFFIDRPIFAAVLSLVIVVAGAPQVESDESEARRVLEILLRELPVRQAADLAAQLTGTAPNVAYKLALRLSGKS